MKKRVMSVFMAIIILIALVPTGVSATNASGYRAGDAVSYAKDHWNDGVGKCATFVSNCLAAGGCSAWSSLVSTLRTQLLNGNWGDEYVLTKNGSSVYQSQNIGKLSAGDPIFYYCSRCAAWKHVVFCAGFNSNGKATAYAHNEAWNNVTYIAGFYDDAGHTGSDITIYSFHMSGTHTHSYDEFAYYWDAHPHYNCYKCSCGEVEVRTNETRYVSTCASCNEEVKAGQYFIKNKGNDEYLNIADAADVDKAMIHTYPYGNFDAQVYDIYHADDGYEMMPLCSKTRVVNPYAWTVESGKTVNLYSRTYESSQWWKFQPMKDGYVIRNVQNPMVCLTLSNSGMIVSEYTGSDNQIWILEKACTIKYNANGGIGAPAAQRLRAGYKTVLSAQKPTKSGSVFLGWSTSKNATVPSWNEKTAVRIYDDTTLYAVWENDHTYSNACDKTCNTCGAKRSTSHSYNKTLVKATTTKNGKLTYKCKNCGYIASTSKTIKYVKTVKLSATSYTYSGGVKTPTVTVKDSSGKTLKKNTDYTVTYSSGRKNVGTYKVTIKFKGNYSGTKTLTFKINPKAASINKLTAKTKGLTVKLNRSLQQSTGYQIQYATTSSFKSYKTATVTSYKTSTKSISGLKKKTKYYVRVRTYKTVAGVKYYSNWSSAKSIKTK